MCGIAGIYNIDGAPVDAGILRRMTNTIRHRGPDDEGYVFLNHSSGEYLKSSSGAWPPPSHACNLGLGHRRLSIIDLSPAGHQPMPNDGGTIWITYNGEIYNYLELAEELKARGHRFRSRSDTEVVLRAYEEYGSDCVKRFNGMWAFAIWDSLRRQLFCSRDRFGEKPFYYAFNGHAFIFASEIKSLMHAPSMPREPNHRMIFNYLANNLGRTDFSEDTLFRGVKQIPPGASLVVNRDGIRSHRYWQLNYQDGHRVPTTDVKRAAAEYYALLEDAVRIRLRSDVPLGGYLSGGLDSSSVVCVVRRLLENCKFQTFNAAFPEKYFDDRAYADAVVEKTSFKSHHVFPDGGDVFEELPKLIWHQDEPLYDLNFFTQWNILRLAKAHNVVVMLNGHGGDESLLGYPWHFTYFFTDLVRQGRWRRLKEELSEFSAVHGVPPSQELLRVFRILVSSSVPKPLKDLLRPKFSLDCHALNADFARSSRNSIELPRRQHQYVDTSSSVGFKVYPLPALLHSEDRMSMAFSLESRTPFLDCRLVEYSANLPADLKLHSGLSKWILREAMKGVLPESVRLRPDKKGFAAPTALWLRGVLREPVRQLLSSHRFKERGYLNGDVVLSEFEAHCRGEKNLFGKIWSWVNLELWFRVFFDDPHFGTAQDGSSVYQ